MTLFNFMIKINKIFFKSKIKIFIYSYLCKELTNEIMHKKIQIKKGLDIKLVGKSKKIITNSNNSIVYAIKPKDFYQITPKLLVKIGQNVEAGSPIFSSKENEKIVFCSPVSGIINEIIKSEKKEILSIKIKSSSSQNFLKHPIIDLKKVNSDEIKIYFYKTGLFPFIEQRPYGIIANPNDTPKEIVISGINSAPLSPDIDFILQGKKTELQMALTALKKMTTGKVHVTIKNKNSIFNSLKDIEIHYGSGPHPIGNVSIQIEKINPINKGEKIWTIHAEDLVVIGEMISKGIFNLERIIAISGSKVKNPHYKKVISGAKISDILESNIIGNNNRIIDGNVLTGTTSYMNEFLGYKTNQITVIEEGNDYQFFGWQIPQTKKFSITRALMFSFLTPNKKYDLNTNTNGDYRSFVLTGHLDKVFPQNIYPLELLKAALAKEIDRMEKLGIYEVIPEDFALTEFIDVSKNNHQEIIRQAINLMIKEVEY